jgi:hypothetical protein
MGDDLFLGAARLDQPERRVGQQERPEGGRTLEP